jgi:hypothetical protein
MTTCSEVEHRQKSAARDGPLNRETLRSSNLDNVVELVNYCRVLWRHQPEWMAKARAAGRRQDLAPSAGGDAT